MNEIPMCQAGGYPVRVTGATVYVLNAAGVNRWMAQVQPGFDDSDKRVSDAECEDIARRIAATLATPAVSVDRAGDGWISVEAALPDPYDDVLVHPRPTDYCCEAHLTRTGWQYSAYEQYNGHVTSPCTVTHWKRLGAPGAAAAAPCPDAEQLEAVRQAIRDYHFALDNREHGGEAEQLAFEKIVIALHMPWFQGHEAAARATQQGAKA